MNAQNREIIGRWISIAIVAGAVVVGCFVLYRTNYYPRTDDAEIFANFIGIAPQVDGPLVRMNVKDNQLVKTGDLLYEIDERPYRYALENALSEQAALEGQIADEQRRIAALVSAVSVAQENIHSAEAEVTDAERGVGRFEGEHPGEDGAQDQRAWEEGQSVEEPGTDALRASEHTRDLPSLARRSDSGRLVASKQITYRNGQWKSLRSASRLRRTRADASGAAMHAAREVSDAGPPKSCEEERLGPPRRR